MHIPYNADNLNPSLLGSAEQNMMSDGIVAGRISRPKAASEALVN
jgi:hypothetical protein